MKEFLVMEFVDDEDCSVAVIHKSWYQQTHDEYGIVSWTRSRNVQRKISPTRSNNIVGVLHRKTAI